MRLRRPSLRSHVSAAVLTAALSLASQASAARLPEHRAAVRCTRQPTVRLAQPAAGRSVFGELRFESPLSLMWGLLNNLWGASGSSMDPLGNL